VVLIMGIGDVLEWLVKLMWDLLVEFSITIEGVEIRFIYLILFAIAVDVIGIMIAGRIKKGKDADE